MRRTVQNPSLPRRKCMLTGILPASATLLIRNMHRKHAATEKNTRLCQPEHSTSCSSCRNTISVLQEGRPKAHSCPATPPLRECSRLLPSYGNNCCKAHGPRRTATCCKRVDCTATAPRKWDALHSGILLCSLRPDRLAPHPILCTCACPCQILPTTVCPPG